MPNQKLRYQVEVDTAGAVSDLNRLGTAGQQAGQDLGDGFKQGATQSEQALQALTNALTDVKTETAGVEAAVSAIKPHLGIEVDDAKIAGFVSDLRSKFGLAFDDITADAKQFADVLEQGVNLDKTSSAIRGVGTELDTVKTHGDQSRSVLANLAGNTAQDLGQLGGVVGSLGVGIGQLAEYAVDGNIAMSQLASVAGPMLGLVAASTAVTSIMGGFSKRAKENAEHMQALNDIMTAGGDVVGAYAERLADVGTESHDAQQGLFDFARMVFGMGTGITDATDELSDAGISLRDYSRAVAGTGDDILRMQLAFDQAREAGAITQTQWETLTSALAEGSRQWEATQKAVTDSNYAMRLSTDDLNDALGALIDPLTIMPDVWNALAADFADGAVSTQGAVDAVNLLASATGLSTDAVIQQAYQLGQTNLATEQLAVTTKALGEGEQDAQAAIDKTTETLQGQVDALQEAIDKRQAMIDSSHDLADAQQAWDDALAELPGIIDETNKAMEDNTAGSEDWLAARNEQRDAAEKDIDLLVEARKQQALANGEQLNAAQIQRTYAEGLGRVASSLSDDVIPSVVDYYSEVLKIPDDKQTEFEMVLMEGDQAAIERFITLNSGTTMMSFKMQADQAHMNTVQGQIDGLAAPRTVPMSTVVSNDKASGQLAVIAAPRTADVTAVAKTDQARSDLNSLANNNWFTTLWVTPRATRSVQNAVGIENQPRSVEPAGVSTLAAPTATTTTSAPTMVAPRAGPNIHVTVKAAVIGNRFDVERAVTRAITQAERMGRLAS